MHVVIFEGSRWHTFAPFSLSRPVFALATGAGTLLDKHVRHLRPTRLSLWVRPALAQWCMEHLAPRFPFPVTVNQPLDDEPALLASGRTLHLRGFEHSDEPCAIVDEDAAGQKLIRKAIVRMPGLTLDDAMNRTEKWSQILSLPRVTEEARMADYAWDLIGWNEEALMDDFVAMHADAAHGPKPAGPYHMVREEDIWIGSGVKLEPGVVLDASRGPVMLADSASIGANSVLKGPCYIGPHCQVKPLTIIHAGTTLGPLCKVGGEISNSIMIGHSNKGHEGYLGDSYVGEWVNLGAGTTTSNLKNTYGPIKVRMGTHDIDTGLRHLGSLIGDHAKTAIGTRLMTGSYIGYSSMIATSGLPPISVPSYSFITDRGREEYRFDKALEVMKTMWMRRQNVWNAGAEAVARYAAEAAGEVER